MDDIWREGPLSDAEYDVARVGLIRMMVAFRRKDAEVEFAMTRLTAEQRARLDGDVNAVIARENHHG